MQRKLRSRILRWRDELIREDRHPRRARPPVAVISPARVTLSIRRGIDSELSFWDSLIVETALAETADRQVTEDLPDGWTLGSLRVWNPFNG